MVCVKRIIGLNFIIISCLFQVLVTSAGAAGFIFSWQPFVADIHLVLNDPAKKVLVKDIYADNIITGISEDFRDMLLSSADQDSLSAQKSKNKFLPDNIKFTFYQTSTFMPDKFEKYTNNDDEQLSQVVNAMTSLIYGESKIKSLETIGKIIEPQVNIYFKF